MAELQPFLPSNILLSINFKVPSLSPVLEVGDYLVFYILGLSEMYFT